MADDLKMADRLWELANLVTGFAVVQNLAFTYSMATHELQMCGWKEHWGAVGGTVLFTIGYIRAVNYCNKEGRSLDATTNGNVWRRVACYRRAAIIAFTVVSIVAIWLHHEDELRKQGTPCCILIPGPDQVPPVR